MKYYFLFLFITSSFLLAAPYQKTKTEEISDFLLEKKIITRYFKKDKFYKLPRSNEKVFKKYEFSKKFENLEIYEKDRFIEYYKSCNHILLWKELKEDGFYYLISLDKGTIHKLYSKPIFSESKQSFFVNSGDISSEFAPLAFKIFSYIKDDFRIVYDNSDTKDSQTGFSNSSYQVFNPRWVDAKKIKFIKVFWKDDEIAKEEKKYVLIGKNKWELQN